MQQVPGITNKLLQPPSDPGLPQAGEEEHVSLEGKTVGNYRLVKKIGGGGFGQVYRAEHVELGNPFAIKVLHNKLANNASFVQRFRTEAMVLAGLHHENVVNVVDFGQHTDLGFYLVMEWLEGRTLHRVWQRKRQFPLSQIYALFSQLLDALQAAHQRGIVHRDMKPENLILTKGSRGRTILKIVDFGIATMVSGKTDQEGKSTEGLIIGTPYYMSPEQAAGRHLEVDIRSDIYACGVILFELMTGRRLFPAKDPKDILRHQIHAAPPRLESVPGKHLYSPLLQAVLDKALAKNKHERYHSAAEMFAELEFAMKAEGIEPDEDGIETNQARPASSLTSLLDLAMGEQFLPDHAHEEPESISTGAGIRGQRQTSSSTGLDTLPPPQPQLESQTALSSSSKASWMLALVGVGLVALILLLLGLQPWRMLSQPASTSLTLPPVVRPSGIHPTPQTVPQERLETTPPTERRPDIRTVETTPRSPETSGQTKQTAPTGSSVIAEPQKRRKRGRRRATKQGRKIAVKRRTRQPQHRKRQQTKRIIALRDTGPKESLILATTPHAAEVFVDGRFRGTTPLTLQLRQGGTFSVQVKKKGFVSQNFVWKAQRRQNKRIRLIEDLF